MSEVSFTGKMKGSLEDLDDKPKKVAKKQKSKLSSSFASAALPDNDIPDTSDQLDILDKGVGSILFSEKEASTIVPTVFTGFNRAIRVGGFPMNAITLIHGPSKGGKTAFCLGLIKSFQMQGHLAYFIDAEHTLDKKFVPNCGVDPNLLKYIAPLTYEETTEKVEKIINNFRNAREKKTISKNTCLLFIVDSITKLVPEKELEELKKVGKGYPLKALMNTAWLDKLTPIVGSLPIQFVILAHEKVKIDAGMFEKKYRVKGGESLIFDSTIAIRIQIAGKKMLGSQGKRVQVATIHKGVVEKSKVGIYNEQFRFVMGMGKKGYPVGIDHAMDVLEEAKLRGKDSPLVREVGAKWTYRDERIKGDENMVTELRENPDLLNEIITELNETSIGVEVMEDTEEGEE
jgi:RecA/RadA recombinase